MTHGKAANRSESCIFWGAGERNVAQVTMSNDVDTTFSRWDISWVKLLMCWLNVILKLSVVINSQWLYFPYCIKLLGHWMGANKATK